MKASFRPLFIAASLSLVGCATDAVEEGALPDVLGADGAADSATQPTAFGHLFDNTWQYGELDPHNSIRNPSWTFTLDGHATVTIKTRKAPVETADLDRTVVYLYKVSNNGSSQQIAKSTGTSGFGSITANLGDGSYRVIIKGVQDDDAGELMLRMDCAGAGCTSSSVPQCLFGGGGEWPTDLRHGALEAASPITFTPSNTSEASAATTAQMIAAAQVVLPLVSTLAQAFSITKDNKIEKITLHDTLGGRVFSAYQYTSTLTEVTNGAIFEDRSTTAVLKNVDGNIEDCAVLAQTCVFGRSLGEAEYMPFMTVVSDVTYKNASDVPQALRPQVIASATYDGHAPTLAEVFDTVDDKTVYATTYRHTDGREFVLVHYYSGDTSVGTFFAKDQTTPLGEISDAEVTNCKAFD